MTITKPQVERYRLDAIIGKGGMGVVRRAFDTHINRNVAIKRLSLPKTMSGERKREAIALFEREYHTLAELAHPRIIQVYDYGVDEQGAYYTMELLEGESLRARAPFPWRQACSLFRDVASSLAILHSRRLVHCDVTPNNIYFSADGHAKLIDFGAMAPMGVSKNFVGTPSCIAPELVQQQAVDGRADLYSLGACLYYVLTARHAYPARDFRQVRSSWRSPPLAPSRIQAEVPPALDQLVLSLLSLAPVGRPSTAAEVFERLTAIADLSTDEQLGVAHAYLNTPTLVGRTAEITTVRRALIRAARRRSTHLVIEGKPGMGRSRFLDASVLEAKIIGFNTIRADAADADAGDFGVARRLSRELVAVDPSLADHIDTIGLFQPAGSEAEHGGTTQQQQRETIISGLNRVLVEASRTRALAVVVDDVHLIDEPSLAFLSSLSTQGGDSRLLLILSHASGAESRAPAAMELISQSVKTLHLRALDQDGCRALLSSVFGEVRNLDALNLIAYQKCGGSPSELMDSARALIERGIVRYEGGSWLISDDFQAAEKTMERSTDVQIRLRELSDDALELISLIALDRDHLMEIGDYAQLCQHHDTVRVHRALDDLIQKNLLQPVGAHHRFVREPERLQVVADLDDARRQTLHLRLAERLTTSRKNPIYLGYHFLQAGQLSRAKEPMRRLSDFADANPLADILRNPILFETVEGVIEGAEREGWLPADYIVHRTGLIINAVYCGMPELVKPHARKTLQMLSNLSGLSDYDKLDHIEESQRLAAILELAQERCKNACEDGVSFNPILAIRRLSHASLYTAAAALSMADPQLLDQIPNLKPLAPLSPVIALIDRLISAMGQLVRGQLFDAWDELEAIRFDLDGIDKESLDAMTRVVLESRVLKCLCGLKAGFAAPGTSADIDVYTPFRPHAAQGFRARYLMAMCEILEAETANRQFEVMSVQAGDRQEERIAQLVAYSTVYTFSDDLMGLKQAYEKFQQVVQVRPGWKYRRALVRAHYLRCRGEIERAIVEIESSLADIDQEHGDWAASAAVHLTLLSLAGNHQRARQIGSDYHKRAIELHRPTYEIELALALCHAESGDETAARHHFNTAFTALKKRGVGGIYLGYCQEIGARIAMACRDGQAFYGHVGECANFYRVDTNPVLYLKFSNLMREAASRGITPSGTTTTDVENHPVSRQQDELEQRLQSILNTTKDSLELFHRSLALIVEHAKARGGALFLNTPEGFERKAVTPNVELASTFDQEIYNYYSTEVEEDGTATVTIFDSEQLPNKPRAKTALGDHVYPFLLEYASDQGIQVCGMVALIVDQHEKCPSRIDAIPVVARVLADREEVIGSVLFETRKSDDEPIA